MNCNIAVVLAGGASARMGGRDKALLSIGGRRLVDIVVKRLERQAARIIISGRSDYGTGLETISDDGEPLRGPAAGAITVARRLRQETPEVFGFATIPVDAPAFPNDLIARLSAKCDCAVAETEDGMQPTFAFWTIKVLDRVSPAPSEAPSLKRLVELTGARLVRWQTSSLFANINSADDLAAYERCAAGGRN